MSTVLIKDKEIGTGRPCICVPIMGATIGDYESVADELLGSSVNAFVDIVEVRADYFSELHNPRSISELMNMLGEKLSDKIILFTVRSEKEGGEVLSQDAPPISELIEYVIDNKLADLVDVELSQGREVFSRLKAKAKSNGVKIIASYHDFAGTPSEEYIVKQLTDMQDLGADIAKIAVMPKNKTDVFTLMQAAAVVEDADRTPIVAISMGALGAISRVAGAVYGSAITFSSMGKSSAPGQIPVAELVDALDTVQKYCI